MTPGSPDILFWDCYKSQKQNEATQFYADLFTPTEQIMITKKLSIAVLLAKGYTYESIIDILKISRSTITTIRNILLKSGVGYRRVINRVLKEKKARKPFITIESILDIVPPKRGSWSEWGKRKWRRKMEKQCPF